MKINYKYFILITVALLSFSVSIYGYYSFYKNIVNKAKESYQARAEVVFEDERRKKEKDLSLLYADTLSSRSRLSSFIVSVDKITEFIEAIEKIGPNSSTDVSLSSINVPDFSLDTKSSMAYTTLHLEVRGTWSNIIRALTIVENMPYVLSLKHMRLSTSEVSQTGKAPLGLKVKSAVGREWLLFLDLSVLTSK